jgi:hypothetical protein
MLGSIHPFACDGGVVRLLDGRSVSSLPSATFRRNARVARRPDTESAPAGTPHASTRNLTLGVVTWSAGR